MRVVAGCWFLIDQVDDHWVFGFWFWASCSFNVSPTKRISPITLDCGAICGMMPSGSRPPMVDSFSLTIWRARYTSMPQSNSTHTKELPKLEPERTRLTFVAPFSAVSMGKVTRRSTSSEAMPWQSVITTTVGAVRSGNTSMAIFFMQKRPPRTMSIVPASTAIL